MIVLLVLLVTLVSPFGCGYYSFTGASIPEHLSTIAIPLGVVLMAAGAYFVLVRPSGDGSSVALSPTGAYGTW